MMTHQQILLVKQTWRLLRQVDPNLLGDVFYGRLFVKYPRVRALFKGSMESQYQKFLDMLSMIVARLDRPDSITPEIAQLAQRHEQYGVKPEHYTIVGEALLWTLEKGLGTDWNENVRNAWEACYADLSQAMLEKV